MLRLLVFLYTSPSNFFKMEIFFNDLKEHTQKEVLMLYGIKTPEEFNLDIAPLFILETEDLTDCHNCGKADCLNCKI